jgi:hypothetical protein
MELDEARQAALGLAGLTVQVGPRLDGVRALVAAIDSACMQTSCT